ncbi:hypothetical protein IWZ03DRAFT_368976 [Phyllosticta citriasiana]|uniref:Secreted protein n=1 Tax=Phyllosticta citriasiana TaxID=595635 RepID=A0ABR1KVB5_9PEZI
MMVWLRILASSCRTAPTPGAGTGCGQSTRRFGMEAAASGRPPRHNWRAVLESVHRQRATVTVDGEQQKSSGGVKPLVICATGSLRLTPLHV